MATISTCHPRLPKQNTPTECSIVVTLDETDNTYTSPQKPDITQRIEEFHKTAEDRKKEFERLLEEHAQVIKRLKQMEKHPSQESST